MSKTNSSFDPGILIPKTAEEREFHLLTHVRAKASVPDVRALLGLHSNDTDIQPTLNKVWQNLKAGVRQLAEKDFDFWDDSPGNELAIYHKFRELPEIKFLLGDQDCEPITGLSPGRMTADPRTLIRWLINNRRQSVTHAHQVGERAEGNRASKK
ncbi:hypothetical protein ABW20_dc0107709 [Dactylellina cionopaga]|nr:hypothetical protein ABW20_dc0107709 [Dactylellina cionopaga]